MTSGQINSAASGYWDVAATWAGGVVPGPTDLGVIKVGHTVTVRNVTTAFGFYVDGGVLILNNHFVVSDISPWYGFNIGLGSNVNGRLYSNVATATAPLEIRSASAVPTYPFTFMIYQSVGPELRTFDLDYFTIKGAHPFFGNDTVHQDCNYPANVNSVWITSVTPMQREAIIQEHPIDNRSHSRIYDRGGRAGTCIVSGTCTWVSHFATVVRDIKASGKRVAVIWDGVTVPFARIEGVPKFTSKRGSLYMTFDITLIEDS